MTARDLKDALGPLAAPLAENSGWSRAAWDTAVHRSQSLTDEQRATYKDALAAHIKDLQKVKREL